MTGGQRKGTLRFMKPPRRRLAIAVAPRLLGEALSRVLAREDRDVVVVLSEQAAGGSQEPGGTGRFDIALVSHDGQSLPASVVIRLPDSPLLGTASVGSECVPINDLAGLVALVERCSAALEAEAGPLVDP